MGLNIIEKILQNHTRDKVEPGKIIILDVENVMVQDGAAGLLFEQFEKFGEIEIAFPEKFSFVIDHTSPAPNIESSISHKRIRDFCEKNKISLYDVGEGICHQIMLEQGKVLPGTIVIGGESHCCTYGAFNSLGIPAGSTDLAAFMATDEFLFQVPHVLKVELRGKLAEGVTVRDLVFYLISVVSTEQNGIRDFVIEFSGESLSKMTISDRITLSNMAVETGAISAIMPHDNISEYFIGQVAKDSYQPVDPDEDAEYFDIVEVHLEEVKKMIALPHSTANVEFLSMLEGKKIDQAVVGTCSCGQIENYKEVADIFNGRKVKVRTLIVPSSRKILSQMLAEGIVDVFIEAGAIVLPPGCGPCIGTNAGLIADGECVISTSTRNHMGVMGSIRAEVFLASPETVAYSALSGKISSGYLEEVLDET